LVKIPLNIRLFLPHYKQAANGRQTADPNPLRIHQAYDQNSQSFWGQEFECIMGTFSQKNLKFLILKEGHNRSIFRGFPDRKKWQPETDTGLFLLWGSRVLTGSGISSNE
jgi:hypothetical protein